MSRGYPDVLPFSGRCEGSGNYAVEVDGRYGDWVDAVGLVCRDGSRVGPFGGTGGGPVSGGRCDEGLTGAFVRSDGTFATQVAGACGAAGRLKSMGADRHGPSTEKPFTCPAGQVVRGVSGTTRYNPGAKQTYIGSMEVQCGEKEVAETNYVPGVTTMSPGSPPAENGGTPPSDSSKGSASSPTDNGAGRPAGPPVALMLGAAGLLLVCCSGAGAVMMTMSGGGRGGGGGDGSYDESY